MRNNQAVVSMEIDPKSHPASLEESPYQSALRIVLTVAFLIFASSVAVMIIVARLPPFPTAWYEAIFSSVLLIIFISPTLYRLCFRPLFCHIREQRKLEVELREALNVKSYFTSMVSHELKTPLAAIKESVSLVMEGIVGPATEGQKDCLKIARSNVERLARLINDILDVQKIESGRAVFDFKEHNLNDLVREVGKTMALLAEKRGLEFRLKLQDELPHAVFDRDKIIQTLTNIVGNAIKFTKKGSVAIATGCADGTLRVAVEDTGCGIKAEDIPKLFQKFTQLGAGRAGDEGGTGLGLAISKEIIERHRGRIWAESVYGQGTTFYFTLPLRRAGAVLLNE